MLYWVPHWLSDEMKDWQRGLHNFVILCTFINFLMKLAVIAMLWLTKRDFLRSQVAELQNEIKRGNIGGIKIGAGQ